MGFGQQLKHAWNAFRDKNQTPPYQWYSHGSFSRPDRPMFTIGNERTIISSIYTRIAIDVAAVNIRHVRTDQNGRYQETINDSLNKCLNLRANLDQTGRAFIQNIAMNMCDEGCVAVVPIDLDVNPDNTSSYEIKSMRVGQIIEWHPDRIQVRVYNEETGEKEDLWVKKKNAAIIENPLYEVMNEPNSTLKRLVNKINLLDNMDTRTGSNKLDLLIQLPYTINSEVKRKRAEDRRKDIEWQLSKSDLGIAYIDATEHVTQLNRSVENNLQGEIEYLTNMLFYQLGLTKEVFEGTADEQTMLNYYSRTIEPFLSAIADEMKTKFLTPTAITQGQSIMFFRDPFRLATVEKIADIADKFTRNEILSSNEVRAIVGYRPIDDPRADELRNKNLNQSNDENAPVPVTTQDEISIEHYGMPRRSGRYPYGSGEHPYQSTGGFAKSVHETGDKKIPNAKKLTDYKGKLYFISQEDMDGKELTPRVADNYFTKNGYEDSTTKRISFAPSVGQCLMGMSYNCTGKTFKVYEPEKRPTEIYQPNEKAVPDSKITGELWVCEPVTIKQVGTIFCSGDSGKDGLPFEYGDGKQAELYEWDYKWTKRK